MDPLSQTPRSANQHRSLLFLGVPGSLLLLTGVVWGVRVVHIYRQIQTLAVGYAIISVLLSTVGSLALFSGVLLYAVRGLVLDLGQLKKTHTPQMLARILKDADGYRPLLLFGLPGTGALLAGVTLGAWIINAYNRTQMLAVGYALITMLLSIIGSLSLLVGIILHALRRLLLELAQPPSKETG